MTISSLEWRAFLATERCEARSTKPPRKGVPNREVLRKAAQQQGQKGARLAGKGKIFELLINVVNRVPWRL